MSRESRFSYFSITYLTEVLWALEYELSYESDVAGTTIYVPRLFVCDGPSVPRAPLAYWLAGNRGWPAAVVHDWLYSIGYNRKLADKIYLEALTELGVSDVRRGMYRAVRWFGGSHHKTKEQNHELVRTPHNLSADLGGA